MSWKFWIDLADHKRSISVFGSLSGPGGFLVLKPLQVEETKDEGLELPEFIRGRREQWEPMLQALVDACWEAGIRPSGVEDFRRVNDARDAHLQDMRHLVSGLMEQPLPGTTIKPKEPS